MGYQVSSVGAEWLSKLLLLPNSSFFSHVAGSQQTQQHEGRQEEHLMVIGDEMVRM